MVNPRAVRVTISEGVLEGELVDNDYGEPFFSFKGIPYAEPPVGDLRFKAPQPPKPWTGIRIANECGPHCYHARRFGAPDIGSEDCLYLNVYTPNLKPNKPLPVMFWIHGGAFKIGSGDDDMYSPEFLIRHDVILVTINFRLEVLGFLCLETEDIPGNAGAKDQVAALKWVNKNIKHFGGDPNNVTIFGLSSGALCVDYHLVSPMSKGLFKRGIAQSGANTRSNGIMTQPRERAIALAKKLGCKSNDDKQLYEFFKTQPLDKLVNANTAIRTAEKLRNELEITFMITSEKKFNGIETFFHGDPYTALRNGIHEGVDVMRGYTTDEGVCIVGITPDIDRVFHLANSCKDYLVPKLIADICSSDAQVEAGNKILKYYFADNEVSLLNIEALIKYYSMYFFSHGTYRWAKICSSLHQNNVYFYKFTCKSERNVFSDILGASKYVDSKAMVCHGDCRSYIFPMKRTCNKVSKDSETFKVIDQVSRLWTNMAKFGNPTPDDSLSVVWKAFDPENQHYLDIGTPFTAKTFPDKDEFDFWEDLFITYAPQYVL